MRTIPTEEEKAKIVDLFLEGHGVNHVQFLMGYQEGGYYPRGYRFDTDDINGVIRDRLRGCPPVAPDGQP